MSSGVGSAGAVSRRRFLKGAAAVAGVAAVAGPTIIPATALGRDGKVAPSERITMAGIGIGNRGLFDLKWAMGEPDTQFVAICDCDKAMRERARDAVNQVNKNQDCKTYVDVREFLAQRDDVDAVLIATSERWHATMAILAMRAGKDVYCEKPGSMTIFEGRALAETARRYSRVFQTGTQRRSELPFIACTELAWSGRLGKVHTVHAHTLDIVTKHDWLPAEPEPPKEELDWDLWLGPVPWRPYNAKYIHGWHGYYDFHTGGIGEWGSHTINQCAWAARQDDTSCVEYQYPGNDSGDGMVCRYPNGIQMKLNAQGWRTNAGDMFHGSCGFRIDGTEGWVACADGYKMPDASHPDLVRDWKQVANEYLEREQRPVGHVRDFLNCVRSRRQPIASAEVSYRTMTTVHAANISTWLKRSVKFDPVKAEFVGDEEANRLRQRATRDPWRL
jgi:predicted dehydrogenase